MVTNTKILQYESQSCKTETYIQNHKASYTESGYNESVSPPETPVYWETARYPDSYSEDIRNV